MTLHAQTKLVINYAETKHGYYFIVILKTIFLLVLVLRGVIYVRCLSYTAKAVPRCFRSILMLFVLGGRDLSVRRRVTRAYNNRTPRKLIKKFKTHPFRW